MADPKDAAPRVPIATHLHHPEGYVVMPLAIMTRKDIDAPAKLVYAILCDLAWRGQNVSEVAAPREVIAARVCLTVKAVTKAIVTLTKAPTLEGRTEPGPMLVQSVRRGQGHPNVYLIADPDTPDSGSSRKAESTFQETSDRPFSPIVEVEEPREDPPNPPLSDPPASVLSGGRNVPLDVLMAVTGVTDVPGNPRTIVAVVALNGTLTKTGKLKAPGIRHLFWNECIRQVSVSGDVDGTRLRALHDDPARFADLLADRIRKKAAAYRAAMPGAMLTPNALRDWWHDVDAQAAPSSGSTFEGLADG